MPLVYRAMTPDGDVPKVGASARALGVRVPPDPNADITPNEAGNVGPERGGMSVAPAWRDLELHRIPRRLEHIVPDATGSNKDQCWKMGEGPFSEAAVGSQLTLRPDEAVNGEVVHGVIGPTSVMSLQRYQTALAATRDEWTVDED